MSFFESAKNWSDLSLFEQIALVISKYLQILSLQPRISNKILNHKNNFFSQNNFGNKIPLNFWSNILHRVQKMQDLTLIGMRGDNFISLSFLDQILLAEFLTKISKLFGRWKLILIGLIWHLPSSLSLLKNNPKWC